jgi:hypothetical protein
VVRNFDSAEQEGPFPIEPAFERFHAENPHVYELFKQFARQVVGFDHYGMKSLFERVRWHLDVETRNEDGLKLNNNYTAYYARLLNREPGMAGFFRTRRMRVPYMDDEGGSD